MTKLAAIVVAFAGTTSAFAQIGYTTGTYSENFDTLPATGTGSPVTSTWTNNSTLPGWLAFGGSSTSNTVREATITAPIAIRVDAGGSNAGGLYTFGSTAASDRALGSTASGSYEGVLVLVIQNNNSFDLTDFTLSYTGEQWRNGGNTSAQSLVFDYTVQAAFPVAADVSAANVTGYTAVPALNFTSPTVGASATALDGNAAANRTTGISSTVSVTIPAGQFLVLRWWDNNDPGNDHGLAIDDLSFSATPTPGAAALLGVGMLAAGRRRRA